jgi:hypothetical protein
MPTVAPCRGCLPLDCYVGDPYSIYSIDGTLYPFVLNCPPGFDCSQAQIVSINCCGTTTSVSVSGAPPDQRATLINQMIQDCIRKLPFCSTPGPPPPGPPGIPPGQPGGPPLQLYFNSPQSVTILCPDGNPFIYTVPAGIFIATSFALANQKALNLAGNQARLHKVCLGSLPAECCSNVAFSAVITATGPLMGTSGNTWNISSGSLPSGFSITSAGDNNATISGTTTASGVFTFSVRIATSLGDQMAKQFSLCVVDISPVSGTLPSVNVGASVSTTFGATGCAVSPVTWSIISGALPQGVTLNAATGALTGRPIIQGSYSFTVQMKDSSP